MGCHSWALGSPRFYDGETEAQSNGGNPSHMACEGQNRAEVQDRVLSPAVALFSPQSQAPHAKPPTNFGAGLRLPLQEG